MTTIIGGGSGGTTQQGGNNNPTGAGGAGANGQFAGGGGGAGYLVGGAGGAVPNSIILGGSGGAGGVHGGVGAVLPIHASAGTDGAAGENGFSSSDGGGGGAGGYGAVVTGTGSLGTLASDVIGGDGGAGGSSQVFYGGGGGRGGIGLYFDNTAGATLTVAASIAGGAGGTAGSGWPSGAAGAGGEGIYGQNLSITLVSGGSISGGLSGDGVRANAIYFEAGTNLLEIQGGTITGNVVANGGNDTFRLSGSTGGSIDISQIQGFEHLGSLGTGTWTLTGTNAATQAWGASSGTLVVNGAMAGTEFSVASGATLGGSGTVGHLMVNSGASVGPGDGSGILHTGHFTLSGALKIELGGTDVGTQYDQVSVSGTVSINGSTLSLSALNDFAAGIGDSFTIIANDGTDAVSGTFNGIREGHIFGLGTALYKLSYAGGDGNDVVLTSVTGIRGGGTGGAQSAGNHGGFNNSVGQGADGARGNGGGGGGAGYLTGGAGGAATSLGAGAGGAGGIHGYVGDFGPNTAAIGTDGTAGEAGTGLGGGGGGGAGGYGAVITSSYNQSLGNTGAITGGNGGAGGDSEDGAAGSGGRGGVGLYVDSAGGIQVSIEGAISGGDGGAGGMAANSGLDGDAGAGGEGIYGQNLEVRLKSNGSISGGLSGDGVRANAIHFTSGTNILDVRGGTITGDVVADGTNDTFRLSGWDGGSFDVSILHGFERMESLDYATWTLTGTNSETQTWYINSSKVIVNGSMANTGFLVQYDKVLAGSGTVGAVTVDSNASIEPGDGIGILHTGDLTLSGTIRIEAGGTTAGTGYDQLSVTGTVTLGGRLDLSLLNGFTPDLGDSFTIIDNDGTDAVSGIFSGYAEGTTIFLGGAAYQVSYRGGDGNDVVLTSVSSIRGGGYGISDGEGGMNNPTGAGGSGGNGFLAGGGGGAGAGIGGAGGVGNIGGSRGGTGGVHDMWVRPWLVARAPTDRPERTPPNLALAVAVVVGEATVPS